MTTSAVESQENPNLDTAGLLVESVEADVSEAWKE
jgi:hypothetical protein